MCIVVGFLVLWIINDLLWSTSRMVLSNLWGGQPKYFSIWQGSCYRVLSPVIFWLFFHIFFFHFPLFNVLTFLYPQVFVGFLFLQAFWWLLNLLVRILPICVVCNITSMAFFSMLDSIPISWLYIITNCIRVYNSFSFLAKILMSTIYFKCLIFFLWLTEFLSGCVLPTDVREWHHG